MSYPVGLVHQTQPSYTSVADPFAQAQTMTNSNMEPQSQESQPGAQDGEGEVMRWNSDAFLNPGSQVRVGWGQDSEPPPDLTDNVQPNSPFNPTTMVGQPGQGQGMASQQNTDQVQSDAVGQPIGSYGRTDLQSESQTNASAQSDMVTAQPLETRENPAQIGQNEQFVAPSQSNPTSDVPLSNPIAQPEPQAQDSMNLQQTLSGDLGQPQGQPPQEALSHQAAALSGQQTANPDMFGQNEHFQQMAAHSNPENQTIGQEQAEDLSKSIRPPDFNHGSQEHPSDPQNDKIQEIPPRYDQFGEQPSLNQNNDQTREQFDDQRYMDHPQQNSFDQALNQDNLPVSPQQNSTQMLSEAIDQQQECPSTQQTQGPQAQNQTSMDLQSNSMVQPQNFAEEAKREDDNIGMQTPQDDLSSQAQGVQPPVADTQAHQAVALSAEQTPNPDEIGQYGLPQETNISVGQNSSIQPQQQTIDQTQVIQPQVQSTERVPAISAHEQNDPASDNSDSDDDAAARARERRLAKQRKAQREVAATNLPSQAQSQAAMGATTHNQTGPAMPEQNLGQSTEVQQTQNPQRQVTQDLSQNPVQVVPQTTQNNQFSQSHQPQGIPVQVQQPQSVEQTLGAHQTPQQPVHQNPLYQNPQSQLQQPLHQNQQTQHSGPQYPHQAQAPGQHPQQQNTMPILPYGHQPLPQQTPDRGYQPTQNIQPPQQNNYSNQQPPQFAQPHQGYGQQNFQQQNQAQTYQNYQQNMPPNQAQLQQQQHQQAQYNAMIANAQNPPVYNQQQMNQGVPPNQPFDMAAESQRLHNQHQQLVQQQMMMSGQLQNPQQQPMQQAVPHQQQHIINNQMAPGAEEHKGPVPDQNLVQAPVVQEQQQSRSIARQPSNSRPSVLDTGVFITPRPNAEVLDEDIAEAIEDEVKELIELFQQGEEGKEEFDEKHQQLLEDYETMPEDRAYYLKLFKEAFKSGDDENDAADVVVITKESRIIEAYEILKEAYDETGQFITYNDFKMITQYASNYDEGGRNIYDESKYYFMDDNDKFRQDRFDNIIRDAVYKLLKYRGSFYTMITSKYFIADEQKKQFFFNASPKVPFYFIYETSPLIQKEMMSKYLENPFNPMMFIQYKQNIEGFDQLTCEDLRVERTINVGLTYSKYKNPSPNLICIGSPCSGKSSFLNDMLKAEFEVIEEKSIGLFHDSVDALFTSKDMPIGFNVFDFQGRLANEDWELISKMLENMPSAYLLLQISENSYFKQLTSKLDKELLKKFSNRVFVVSKNKDDRQSLLIKKTVRTAFKLTPERLNELKGNTSGPNYERACKEIYEFIAKDMKANKDDFEQENLALADELRQLNNKSPLEYEKIYSAYWLLEDSLQRINSGKNFNVIPMKPEFRAAHIKAKQFLFSQQDVSMLSRKKIFPKYMKEYELLQLEKQLKQNSDDAVVQELQAETKKLNSLVPQHGELYNMFKRYVMKEEREIAYDVLELVEAHYLPRVKDDQKSITEIKLKSDKIEKDILVFEEEIGRLKADATPEEKVQYNSLKAERQNLKKELDRIMKQIEDKVLDSELFFREIRQDMLTQDDAVQKQFHEIQARVFEDGNAMEIIDGDIDQVERVTFTAVVEWVQKQCGLNNKLLVVTIMGPQSSGKSTLLNYLVGAKFHVSAGRCTKGLNAMLLRTDFEETREMLILDSEGIFSIERQDPMYDRRLAIFCLSVSNMLLINIKGELNIEIEKVLQVAIFALNRIAEVAANLKKARIHFILRDQIDSGVNQMEQAFTTLKGSLRQAAAAAGAQLDDLIVLPDQPDKIISMFASALSLEQVNNNDQYVQTRSSNVFRQECSKLRLLLMDIAKNLEEESRIVNIQKWGQDVTTIWTSVNENDDLVMIRDLKYINDYKDLVIAIEDFRKLMSAPAPEEAKDNTQEPNPLLQGTIPDAYKEYQIIDTSETIFALFDSAIMKSLQDQDQRHGKGISLIDFRQKQEADFVITREEWLLKTKNWAKNYTSKMSEELQKQATSSVENIVNMIYQKSMLKWKEAQASKTVEDSLTEMLEKLKEKIIKYKEENRNINEQMFQTEIENQSYETQEKIKKEFFKSEETLISDAKDEFKEIAQMSAKAEENKDAVVVPGNVASFAVLKSNPKCFKLGKVKATPFEERDIKIEYIQDEILEWCRPEEVTVKASITNYVEKNDQTYLELKAKEKRLDDNIKDIEQDSGWFGSGIGKKSDVPDEDRQNLLLARQTLAICRKDRVDFYLQETLIKIKQTMKQNWVDLGKKIGEVINEVSKDNIVNKKQQNLPQKYIDMLLEIFNNELKKQGEGQKVKAHPKDLSELYACIFYETQLYIEAFNQILYNMLLLQVTRNNDINLDEVKKKLQEKRVVALEYYKRSSQAVESDAEAAQFFVRIVVDRVYEVLSKELQQKFTDHMYGMDAEFDKKTVMDKSLERFKDANDLETIILHMENPVELERQIFREMYMSKQRSHGIKLIQTFKDQMRKALKYIELFLKEIRGGFGNLGASKSPIKPAELSDIYQYLYGEIFKLEVQDNKLQHLCAKKAEVIKHKLFDNNYDWRERQQKSLFSLDKWVTAGYTELMTNNDIPLLDKPIELQNLNVFFQMMKFQSDSSTSEINKLVKELTEKFIREIKDLQGKDINHASAEKVALGCLKDCFFCGARCTEPNSCEEHKREHKTMFHRPMAFKGTHEKVNKNLVKKPQKHGVGRAQQDILDMNNQPRQVRQQPVVEINPEAPAETKKVLLKDFCTSANNLKESRWPIPDAKKSQAQALLERLGDDLNLTTEGMNVFLKWETGSDLDINVMCGCGKWHGYGCIGGSGGKIHCDKCEMSRDYDVTTGDDGRDSAFEHAYFANPQKLYGKTIGVAAFNYCQMSDMPRNDFTLVVINKFGAIIYPEQEGNQLQRDPSWMFCQGRNKSQSKKQEFVFTEEMDQRGKDGNAKGFKDHVKAVQEINGGGQWSFDEAEVLQNAGDQSVVDYRKSWNLKWALVKDIMCGPERHDSELLDDVIDYEH